jgi:hypothetical protein
MNRELFNKPSVVDWDLLENEIGIVYPDVVDVNDVNGQVAVYSRETFSEQDVTDIGTVITNHTGVNPNPEPKVIVVSEAAITDLQSHLDDPAISTVEDVKTVLKDFFDSIQ